MAKEKSREVSEFVKLIKEADLCEAAILYEKLVEDVTCNYANDILTEEREHQLQLKPTQAYRKLKRLLSNQDAVRGILDMLVDLDYASCVLETTNKIAPAMRFSNQIASCDVAVQRFCRLGSELHSSVESELCDGPSIYEPERIVLREYYIYVCTLKYIVASSPDFVTRALDGGLFSMLMANYPYPCKPPRNRERAELLRKIGLYTAGCLHYFLKTPENRERILRSDRAPVLVPYVTQFLTMVIGIVKRFPDMAFEVQTMSLLDSFELLSKQAKEFVPDILSGDKFDALIRVIKDVRPHFGKSVVSIADSLLTSARADADVDEAAVCSSHLGRMNPDGAAERLAGPIDKSKVDPNLEERLKRCASDFAKEVSGYKPGVKKGASGQAKQKLQRLVTELFTALETGLERGAVSQETFDAVGSDVLRVRPVALPVLPTAGHPYIIAVLIFCGMDSVARWQEYTRVMVGVNFQVIDTRHADLAWPFTALLFGALNCETVSKGDCGEQLAIAATFKPSLGRASSFLPASALQGLVKQCWAVIDEAGTGPFDQIYETICAVEIMRCCCEDYPAILDFVFVDPAPLTLLLDWVTKRLAFKELKSVGRPRSGDPPNKPITPE